MLKNKKKSKVKKRSSRKLITKKKLKKSKKKFFKKTEEKELILKTWLELRNLAPENDEEYGVEIWSIIVGFEEYAQDRFNWSSVKAVPKGATTLDMPF